MLIKEIAVLVGKVNRALISFSQGSDDTDEQAFVNGPHYQMVTNLLDTVRSDPEFKEVVKLSYDEDVTIKFSSQAVEKVNEWEHDAKLTPGAKVSFSLETWELLDKLYDAGPIDESNPLMSDIQDEILNLDDESLSLFCNILRKEPLFAIHSGIIIRDVLGYDIKMFVPTAVKESDREKPMAIQADDKGKVLCIRRRPTAKYDVLPGDVERRTLSVLVDMNIDQDGRVCMVDIRVDSGSGEQSTYLVNRYASVLWALGDEMLNEKVELMSLSKITLAAVSVTDPDGDFLEIMWPLFSPELNDDTRISEGRALVAKCLRKIKSTIDELVEPYGKISMAPSLIASNPDQIMEYSGSWRQFKLVPVALDAKLSSVQSGFDVLGIGSYHPIEGYVQDIIVDELDTRCLGLKVKLSDGRVISVVHGFEREELVDFWEDPDSVMDAKVRLRANTGDVKKVEKAFFVRIPEE